MLACPQRGQIRIGASLMKAKEVAASIEELFDQARPGLLRSNSAARYQTSKIAFSICVRSVRDGRKHRARKHPTNQKRPTNRTVVEAKGTFSRSSLSEPALGASRTTRWSSENGRCRNRFERSDHPPRAVPLHRLVGTRDPACCGRHPGHQGWQV